METHSDLVELGGDEAEKSEKGGLVEHVAIVVLLVAAGCDI